MTCHTVSSLLLLLTLLVCGTLFPICYGKATYSERRVIKRDAPHSNICTLPCPEGERCLIGPGGNVYCGPEMSCANIHCPTWGHCVETSEGAICVFWHAAVTGEAQPEMGECSPTCPEGYNCEIGTDGKSACYTVNKNIWEGVKETCYPPCAAGYVCQFKNPVGIPRCYANVGEWEEENEPGGYS